MVFSLLSFGTIVYGQDGPIGPLSLDQAAVDKIVKKFTSNEGAFREALKDYVFTRYATVNTIGMGGQITGTYKRDSQLIFTHDGLRFERISPLPSQRFRRAL